jgi:hypothetical protein
MANPLVTGLLAPVPLDHLVDGVDVCRLQGKVAFGTRAWESFQDLKNEAGEGAPVLIYASHAKENLGPVITWTARFAGWVEAVGGGHPDGDLFRPPSTQLGDEDRSGYWFGFWEVTDLCHLDANCRIPISSLHDRRGRKYDRGFIPEGPILVSSTGGLDRLRVIPAKAYPARAQLPDRPL